MTATSLPDRRRQARAEDQARADGSGRARSPRVQAGRVDLDRRQCAPGPNQRAAALSLTDPTGLLPERHHAEGRRRIGIRLASLENRKVGSMTGFSFLPELRKIPGLELIALRLHGRCAARPDAGPHRGHGRRPTRHRLRDRPEPVLGLRNTPFTDNNPDIPAPDRHRARNTSSA